MTVTKDTVVTMDYALTDQDGNLLDSSEGRGPLSYVHGAGTIIPGLENALEGKEPGAHVEAVVEPSDAYGERDEERVVSLPRERFSGVDTVEPGMQFQAQVDGQTQILTVQEAGEEEVTVDANHPLAGKTLTFKVDIREVREAEETEKEQGRVAEDDSTGQ